MTKAELTTEIQTIDDNGLNTALELRTLFEKFRDEFYQEVITETKELNVDANGTILASTIGSINYNITFSKIGNKVFVSGRLYNSGGTFGNTDIINIVNPKFYPKFSQSIIGFQNGINVPNNNLSYSINLTNNTFFVGNPIYQESFFMFSGFYFTND